MEITRSAFERSSRDSQQIGNELIWRLNTPVAVFASTRVKLIASYHILALLTATVELYWTTRSTTSTLHERSVNQLLETSQMAVQPLLPQNLPATALRSELYQATRRSNPTNRTEVDVRIMVERSIPWVLA